MFAWLKVALLVLSIAVAIPFAVKYAMGFLRNYKEVQKAASDQEKATAHAESIKNLKRLCLLAGGFLLFVIVVGTAPVN